MSTSKRYRYDAPEITRDEATELCVHHLRMAAALFQVVPDDNNSSIVDEIHRQCAEDIEKFPALAWVQQIHRMYEKLAERTGG